VEEIFIFSIVFGLVLGPNHTPILSVLEVVSMGVKWQEYETDHSLQLSAEVKVVELYLQSLIHFHSVLSN
jgi:hypothetical protein